MIYVAMALVTGAMVVVSMVLNSKLAGKIGVLSGTLVNYAVGLIGITVFLLATRGGLGIDTRSLGSVPKWAYFGGAVGVFVVSLSNIVIPKIPTIYSSILIFIGQISAGMAVDYFLMDKVSPGKILGTSLVLLGLAYNVAVDRAGKSHTHCGNMEKHIQYNQE